MFGIKKRRRIRLANPNYWIMDEYHQHENEGRETMMTTKEQVTEMRESRGCSKCADLGTPVHSYPCSDCYGLRAHPAWQPSALFLALEEALSVAADKPVEAKAMTGDEAIRRLEILKGRYACQAIIDPSRVQVIQYAIDAIRRDAEMQKHVTFVLSEKGGDGAYVSIKPDRDTMLFCPDCQKLLVRSTCTEVEKEYVKEKLAALRKVLVGNLAFGEWISIRPLLDIINRIKTDA